MKKFIQNFRIILCLVIISVILNNPLQAQFRLTILHNNDGESKLINAGTGALINFGGVARFKTLLDTLRAQSTEAGIPNIMLSSGDNFLAGPEFHLSQELPYGTPYYDAVAMNAFDYDAICIGNHEFDFGPNVLAEFIRGFTPLPQAPWLSANLGFAGEDSLNILFLAGRIAPKTVINVNGELVGIIGATTPRLPSISSPGNVTVDTAVASIVQSQVNSLIGMGVNKIILISHLQTVGEDTLLCKRLSGVDVMIAGGGSEVLANPGDLLVPGDVVFGPYPLLVKNIDNINTPIITTEGAYKYIGKLIVEFDATGNLILIDTASGPVRVAGGANPDAVTPNTQLTNDVITPVQNGLNVLAANIIGISNVPLDGIRNNVRSRETNLGNLIGDAFLWKATELSTARGLSVPQIAFQNGGGIRNNSLIPAGNISELITFSILPFANFLCVVPNVSRSQVKEILENAVSRVPAFDGRFAQVSGMFIKWNVQGVSQVVDNNGIVLIPGTKIIEVRLNDGAFNSPGTFIVDDGNLVPGDPLTIATINFLADGGDQYPFRGVPFTTFGGVTYQGALLEYIEEELNGIIDSTVYPNMNTGRIVMLDEVLPVELNSFTSSVIENDVILSWTTSFETNNSGFEVERKTEENDFEKISFVNGQGTTTTSHEYSFNDNNLTAGKYNYRLKQIDFNGNYEFYNLSNEIIIGVPAKFSLSQNYPNPFNPVTKINFDLPVNSFVTLKVFDVLGNEIKTIINQSKIAGSYSIVFNGENLSSGVYFYKLTTDNFSKVLRMTILK